MKLGGGQIVVQTLIHESVPYIVGIPDRGALGLSDALNWWWDVPVPVYLAQKRAQYERERSEER